jgi:hypothetical protein
VRRTGRLTTPQGENVSAAEFEQMKAELGLDDEPQPRPSRTATAARPARPASRPAQRPASRPAPTTPAQPAPETAPQPAPESAPKAEGDVQPAPDIAENDGVAPVSARGTGASKSKRRSRRHGRR